jgi:hypothetical protein
MNERLLQYIWQFQYYQQQHLQTTSGESLQILHPGTLNTHQGPDFSAARIRIGQTILAGHIELHILSSDWHRHKHSGDTHYNNVILHVVWTDDGATPAHIPVLVLENRVSTLLLERYTGMMQTISVIACHHHLPVLNELAWFAWKERLMVERLERKSQQIILLLQQSQGHWDEVFWWQLAAGFGSKINAAFFERVAKSIPYAVLKRHRHHLDEIEALLFGQAKMIHTGLKDPYAKALLRNHQHLKKKYALDTVDGGPVFLRMRPASFPTIRLAQLAMLLHQREHLLDQIRQVNSIEELMRLFQTKASHYWNTHFVFDEPVSQEPRFVGQQMLLHLMINVVVPILFAYGQEKGNAQQKEKVLHWLYQLAPEQNKITRYWKSTGIPNRSALDTQSLLELHTQYCVNKRCLECSVGNRLLRG